MHVYVWWEIRLDEQEEETQPRTVKDNQSRGKALETKFLKAEHVVAKREILNMCMHICSLSNPLIACGQQNPNYTVHLATEHYNH